jgi:hypothetical protein
LINREVWSGEEGHPTSSRHQNARLLLAYCVPEELFNPFITEPVLQITRLCSLGSKTGTLIILSWAMLAIPEFLTMNREDDQLQFDTKQNNLRSYYAHGLLCLEHVKVAIA